jgi:molybdopterin/thiamine biosynthesis adenylyltransferase
MEVRIFGAGGIGYHLWENIIRKLLYLEERSNVYIIDGDLVQIDNVTRQFSDLDVGMNKAKVLAIAANNRFSLGDKVIVRAVPEFLNNETVKRHRKEWIKTGHLFLGCVDQNQSRLFLEKEVSKLKDFIYVDGGNAKTTGQAMAYMKRNGRTILPKLSAIAPEMKASAGDPLPGEGSCLTSGPQTAMANRMVAMAMECLVDHILSVKKPTMNEIRISVEAGTMVPRLSKPIKKRKKPVKKKGRKDVRKKNNRRAGARQQPQQV